MLHSDNAIVGDGNAEHWLASIGVGERVSNLNNFEVGEVGRGREPGHDVGPHGEGQSAPIVGDFWHVFSYIRINSP